jgi:hypothetical protein
MGARDVELLSIPDTRRHAIHYRNLPICVLTKSAHNGTNIHAACPVYHKTGKTGRNVCLTTPQTMESSGCRCRGSKPLRPQQASTYRTPTTGATVIGYTYPMRSPRGTRGYSNLAPSSFSPKSTQIRSYRPLYMPWHEPHLARCFHRS